jgi:hypothetical protein
MTTGDTASTCVLAEALRAHVVGAEILMAFIIPELGGTQGAGVQTTEFSVRLENVGETGKQTHRLILQWNSDAAPHGKPPMKEYRMTDYAARGLACAVLWHFTGKRVHRTSIPGQGFDYWVGGETAEQGLKVGGTRSDDAATMQQRHAAKRRQLFSSLRVGGYVVIVGLARREIILSYHAPKEAAARKDGLH